MSLETEQTEQESETINSINFGTELADSLWITICNYLEPFERFKLCSCCHDLNELLSIDNYPLYSFYKSDINFWINNIEWILSPIKTKRTTNLTKYAFNFHRFDSININILLSIKYYIIFYHKICDIRVNQKIQKIQHLLKLKDANQNIMARLSDDEYYEYDQQSLFQLDSNNNNDDERIIDEELKTLQIDLNQQTDFLPTTIIHIYLHEISNDNQFMIHWISDILIKCNSQCHIFRDTHFDKSNLNNQSINYLCDALMARNTSFDALRNLFFSGNIGITDQCIPRLLNVLYTKCPGLVYLNLDRTGITNKTCHIIHQFYTKFLNLNDIDINTLKNRLPKFEYIDLSNNMNINIQGIDIINDIFIKFGQFNIDNNLIGNNDAIELNVDIDVANCNWSVARYGWSQHILYDE